jgi:hypothetical protein
LVTVQIYQQRPPVKMARAFRAARNHRSLLGVVFVADRKRHSIYAAARWIAESRISDVRVWSALKNTRADAGAHEFEANQAGNVAPKLGAVFDSGTRRIALHRLIN